MRFLPRGFGGGWSSVRLGEAPSHGLPIHMYDARCPGTAAYRELAQEVIERNESEDWRVLL